MGNLKFFTVSIPLEEDGTLMRRIQASADARGISFECALEEAVNICLWPHIERNVDMVDHLREHVSTL